MKCKHVQQKMLDYTEHVLDGHAQQQIADHLQSCRECSQELRAIQGTLELLSSTPTFQAPPESFWDDFTTDVMRKVRAATPPTPPRSSFSVWQIRLAAACAMLLVIMAGIYAYQTLRPQAPIMTTQTVVPFDEQTITPALDTALQRIIPEELPQGMLDTGFALLDDMGSPDALLAQTLNLPEDRSQRLLETLHDARSIRRNYQTQRKKIEDRLETLLQAAPPEQARLQQALEELETAETRYYQQALQADQALRDLLSVEEQAKYILFQRHFTRHLQDMIVKIRQERLPTQPQSNFLLRRQDEESVIRQPR